uniref:Pyridoxal kinase n=1 Tax=Caenorhabditis japonica TaxID=281687 RepID=A0A8R1E3Y8_CAEJA
MGYGRTHSTVFEFVPIFLVGKRQGVLAGTLLAMHSAEGETASPSMSNSELIAELEVERDRRVLSIQSHVVHGYAGNKCSVFPLQKPFITTTTTTDPPSSTPPSLIASNRTRNNNLSRGRHHHNHSMTSSSSSTSSLPFFFFLRLLWVIIVV